MASKKQDEKTQYVNAKNKENAQSVIPPKSNALHQGQIAGSTGTAASFGGRNYVFDGGARVVSPVQPQRQQQTGGLWRALTTRPTEDLTRRKSVSKETGRETYIGFDPEELREYKALERRLEYLQSLSPDQVPHDGPWYDPTKTHTDEIEDIKANMYAMRSAAGLAETSLDTGDRARNFFGGTLDIIRTGLAGTGAALKQERVALTEGKYSMASAVYESLPEDLKSEWDDIQRRQQEIIAEKATVSTVELSDTNVAAQQALDADVLAFVDKVDEWYSSSGTARPVSYQQAKTGRVKDYYVTGSRERSDKAEAVEVDLAERELASIYLALAKGETEYIGLDGFPVAVDMARMQELERIAANGESTQPVFQSLEDKYVKMFQDAAESKGEAERYAGGEEIPSVVRRDEMRSAKRRDKAIGLYERGMERYAAAQNGLSVAENVLMDVAQQMVTRIPDIVASSFFGSLGGKVSMAIRSFGLTYTSERAKGKDHDASMDTAVSDSAIDVASEMIAGPFGKIYGASWLGSVTKGVFNNPYVRWALQSAGEAFEEGIAGVAKLAVQHASQWDDGTQTFWQELQEQLPEIVYEMIVAGIAGGVYAGYEGVADSVNQRAIDQAIYEVVQTYIPELVQEGAASPKGTKANKTAAKNQAQLDRGRALTPKQAADQYRANEAQFEAEDRETIRQAVTARLTELGETGVPVYGDNGTIDSVAAAITKQTLGEKLTGDERRIITQSKYGRQVLAELSPESVLSGRAESEWARQLNTTRIGAGIYGSAPYLPGTNDTRSLEDKYLSYLDRERGMTEAAEAERQAVIAKMAGVKTESGYTLSRPKTPSRPADRGGEVSSNPVRAKAAVPASPVAIKTRTAPEISDIYNEGQDQATFNVAASAAYRAGLTGLSIDSVDASENLTVAQRAEAYKRGQAEAKARRDHRNETTKTKKRNGSGTVRGKGINLEDVRKTFNDAQNKTYRFLSAFAKGTGINIVLYDSSKETGALRDADGEFVYDEDTIYIDIRSGLRAGRSAEDLSQYTMLRTFTHEFTHFMEKWDADGYEHLRRTVFRYLSDKGRNVSDLIDMTAAKYGLDEDLASREVIAEGLADILPQSDFIERMYNQNRTLWEKIVSELKKFIANIKAQFRRMTPDRRTEAFKDENLKYAEELVRLWTDVAERAVTRYQAAEVKAESEGTSDTTLEESGIEADEKSEFGTVYSVKQLLDESTRGKVVKALTDRFGVSRDEATSWINAETSMASIILNPKYSVYLDYEGDPNETAIKMNSDYPQGTVDFSNICKKRREFTQVMNRVLRKFPDHVFAATDLAKIRSIMGEEGMTLPCHICYVEDRRQLDSLVGQDFIDSLKLYRGGSRTRPNGKPFNTQQLKALEMVSEGDYIPSIYELVTLEGRNSLKAKNPDMAAAWEKFNNARGMQSVRLLTNEAEYQRQILKYSPKTVQSKNDHGGLRIYSFSDAEMFHLIDIVQVITDSAAVGLKIQGYTKVNEYAKAVKDTGEKLNRSLIPAGDLGYHMEDGKVVLDYDNVEGIDTTHPDFFDSKDNPDVGNILIGINPTQIRAAMTSDFVDFIIPFHTGQSAEVLKEKKIGAWKNYKDSQSERDIATGKKSGHQINIYTEVIQAAEAEGRPIKNKRDFVNKFLEVCRDNGLEPRFSEFLNTDSAGNYVYTEGYHKFLVDFKMFAQTEEGEYLPQMPVKPVFDDAYISKILKDYVKEQRQKDADIAKQMPKVVERISNEIINPRQAEGDVEGQVQSARKSAEDARGKAKTVGGKITSSMTDAERTAILMEKSIKAATYEGQADDEIRKNISNLESRKMGLVKSALIRIGEEFDVFTDYSITDVEVKFSLSKSNLKESVSKEVSAAQLAKLLPILKETVENAVGVERHENRYFYDSDTLMFENLLGGFVDGANLIPVRFGLKHSKTGGVTLYVIVDQHPIALEKIKAEVVNTPRAQSTQERVSRSAYEFSINNIIPFVNGKDLLRYLPDDMLSIQQKESKWEAIADTIKKIKDKNDRKYFEYLRKGDIRNAGQMVMAAAKAAGYDSPKLYHGTPRKMQSASRYKLSPEEYASLEEQYDDKLFPFVVFNTETNHSGLTYTATSREAAENFAYPSPGTVFSLYARMHNPFVANEHINTTVPYYDSVPTPAEMRASGITKETVSTEEIAHWAKSNGYDGVIVEGIREGAGIYTDDYIVFSPSQLKSADPVTYDDNGNVIPLSERFKAEEPDIRYSRKQDSMSDLEVLELAAKSLPMESMPEGRKKALEDFRTKLDKLRDLQQQRAELGRQYREQMFTKGGDRSKAGLTHSKMESLDRKIESATNTLLTMRNRPVFRQILGEARKIIAANEKAKGQATLQAYRARRNESDAKRKYRERAEKTAKDLLRWLTSPDSKDMRKRVPVAMQESLRDLLMSIDFSSKRALSGKAPTGKDRDFYRKMKAMQDAVEANIRAVGEDSGYADIRPEFLEEFEALVKKVDSLADNDGYVINQMSGAELNELSKLLKEVQHYIAKANATVNNSAFSSAHEMGHDTIVAVKKLGRSKGGNLAERFMLWQNMRPAYVFPRFGKAGESLYEEFRQGQSKQARRSNEVVRFSESVFTPEQVKAWGEKVYTFDIGGDSVKIPLTHIMSMYCLSKRPAGLNHLMGGGFRVVGVKSETIADTGHSIDGKKLAEILATLDRHPEAKAVADKLQQYMSTALAGWGNEVDMVRFGVPKFTETNYFPVNSDGRHLAATADEKPQQVSLYALLNAGFTKAVNENADNRLLVYNIFDVFANHAASMIQYSSFALPILDTLKWFNHKDADGTTVRDALAQAFGGSADKNVGSGSKSFAEDFILNLIKSYNGTGPRGDIYESLGQKLLQNYNRAQVAFSVRTMVQQPTSIFRAATVLPYNKLMKGLGMSAVQMRELAAEMEKYSGIALWKSMGFYDVNISRGLTEMIKQDGDWRSKVTEAGMKGAEMADRYTWAAIWYAAKSEVNRSRYNTEAEYFEAVTNLFEDVIYKTQVVDSVLTKSEAQRATGFFAKDIMSFMSEPTATVSMLADAYMQYNLDARKNGFSSAWQNNRRNIGKILTVYSVAAVMNALAQSLADAWRDDDEYESFWDKYVEALKGNVTGEINPLTKLPLVSDVLSFVADGYEPTAAWAQGISTLKKGVDILMRKTESSDSGYTLYGGIYNVLRGLSGITGVPAATALREVVDIWNNTAGRVKPDWILKTYESGARTEIRYAFEDGFIDKAEAVALLAEEGMSEIEATFTVDEWSMLAETDIAFGDMQKAYVDGELSDEQVKDYLVRYGHENPRDAAEKQLQWKMEADTGIRYSGLKDAYVNGEVTNTDAVAYLKKYGGLSQEDAEAKVLEWSAAKDYGINIGSSTTGIKTALIEGFITPEESVHIMMTYDGKTEEEARVYTNQYLFTKETGYDFSEIGEAYADGVISYKDMVDWYTKAYTYSYNDAAEADLYAQVAEWKATVPGAEGFNKTALGKWIDYGYHTTEAGLGREEFAWAASLYIAAKGTDSMEKGEVFYRELYNRYLRGEITFAELEALARSFYSDRYYKRYKFW